MHKLYLLAEIIKLKYNFINKELLNKPIRADLH